MQHAHVVPAAVLLFTICASFAKEESEVCAASPCAVDDSVSEVTLLQTQLKIGGEPRQAGFEEMVSTHMAVNNTQFVKMFATEAGSSEAQQAYLKALHGMASYFSQDPHLAQNSGRPRTIQSICTSFGLDAIACGRVKDYLGPVAQFSKPMTVHSHVSARRYADFEWDQIYAASIRQFSCFFHMRHYVNEYGRLNPKQYVDDFCESVASAGRSSQSLKDIVNRPVLFSLGDHHESACFPTFFKTRRIHPTSNSVVMDLDHERHWGPVPKVADADMPFSWKMKKLIWRGASTGACDAWIPNTRMMFAKKWYDSSDPRIDVGFTLIVQQCGEANAYKKPFMSIADQLNYKYIMVVNGNDKATSLNWVLASNSVPFMTKPTIESWLLETSLRPGVHYVEVKPDFSDLKIKLDWADQNPTLVERIAENGRQYMSRFQNVTTEANVQGALMTAYLERVSIIEAGDHSEDRLYC